VPVDARRSNGLGTRGAGSRHTENGVTTFAHLSTNTLIGRTEKFERELLDGINASHANLKAAAELG